MACCRSGTNAAELLLHAQQAVGLTSWMGVSVLRRELAETAEEPTTGDRLASASKEVAKLFRLAKVRG